MNVAASTLAEFAKELRKKPRWLMQRLRANPADENGEPCPSLPVSPWRDPPFIRATGIFDK
jgi:hypothetical protein